MSTEPLLRHDQQRNQAPGLIATEPGAGLRPERYQRTHRHTVEGELDARNSRLLELLGLASLEQDVDRLVLDCGDVTDVGPHGLAAIIELDRAACERAAVLRIDRPSRVLSRLLDLAGLSRLVVAPSDTAPGHRTVQVA